MPPIPNEFQSLLFALFLPQTLNLSNKILIFLYSIVAYIDYIPTFVKISYDSERERERERKKNIIFLKKYVDNNKLTSRLLQNVLLLMKVTPILDQAVFSFP